MKRNRIISSKDYILLTLNLPLASPQGLLDQLVKKKVLEQLPFDNNNHEVQWFYLTSDSRNNNNHTILATLHRKTVSEDSFVIPSILMFVAAREKKKDLKVLFWKRGSLVEHFVFENGNFSVSSLDYEDFSTMQKEETHYFIETELVETENQLREDLASFQKRGLSIGRTFFRKYTINQLKKVKRFRIALIAILLLGIPSQILLYSRFIHSSLEETRQNYLTRISQYNTALNDIQQIQTEIESTEQEIEALLNMYQAPFVELISYLDNQFGRELMITRLNLNSYSFVLEGYHANALVLFNTMVNASLFEDTRLQRFSPGAIAGKDFFSIQGEIHVDQ